MARSTTRKTTTKKTPVKTAAPTAQVVSAAKPVVAGPMLKKKELIERVVEKSGIKKKDAKPVIEAMLDVLGTAIASGEELNLQPFGKVKVNREKEMSGAKIFVCKIRQTKQTPSDGPSDLAKAAE
ncbi:HU family DNA-binding protein [Nereida sp. MMG025]|uniref:HU family DNA-binding protein n=1 Tax=Nereida sp. MMG025 TaxID=2909981 RepID=UPI001F02FC44|nr:HU family DNA-binding protein [Nereida sp. MMG025]MCF6443662.1 HU family DNA-binding protein [Nereida sp. MMG025]